MGEDNNSKLSLTTDGIDLSNIDFGEHVGDSKESAKLKGLLLDKLMFLIVDLYLLF